MRRARMSGPNARSAPKGWEAVVVDLAEKHADELERRTVELRSLVDALRSPLTYNLRALANGAR
jgi:hypothetical protein